MHAMQTCQSLGKIERECTKRMFEIILLWLARSPYVSMKHRHVHAQLSPKPALGPACTNCPSQRGVCLIESQKKGQ